MGEGHYAPGKAMASYIRWYQGGHGVDAWDTGPLAAAVFSRVSSDSSEADMFENARDVDAQLGGMTAGVNAVHRIAPLAALANLTDADLTVASHRESRLTHWNPLSQHCCAFFTALCRRLLQKRDVTLQEALQELHIAMETGAFLPSEPEMKGSNAILLRDVVGRAISR